MASHKITFLLTITIIISFALTLNAQSKFITQFCNQRKTTDDRAFCIKVFRSKPVSETANDNPTLLKIALDLITSHATSTRDFIANLEKDTPTDAEVHPALQECISAYDDALKNLKEIGEEIEDDPPMSSYDAQMANDAFSRCDVALSSTKTPHDPISIRHKIGVDYGRLLEEIAENI